MDVSSTLTAFLAGLGTSLHCSAMCGPMACAFRVRPLEYHLSRLISYTVAGALCGGLGQLVRNALHTGPLRIAPWFFLVALILMATGIEKRLPMPSFLLKLSVYLRLNRTLGWFTPLIPCGPLWLMLGVAATTGSAKTGALFLLVFTLGTIPLYLALQLGWNQIQRLFAPAKIVIFQRSIIWCAVVVMAWRLLSPSPNGCCSL